MEYTYPLEFKNVSFSYDDKKVIEGFNLAVEKEKITSIKGENGAGKSTIAKLGLGLVAPDEGNVLIFGNDTKKSDEKKYRSKIGGLLQNPEMQIINLTVFDDVLFTLKNLGLEKNVATKKANSALEELHIMHLKDKSTFELSGGEKQIVAIAGAIAAKPKLLVFDEPTSMLDETSAKHFFWWIKNYTPTGGTMLIITHDDELLKISDKIVDLSC